MIALTAFILLMAGMAIGHFVRAPIMIGPFYIDEVIPRKCD